VALAVSGSGRGGGSPEEKRAQVRRIRDAIRDWLADPPDGTFSLAKILGRQAGALRCAVASKISEWAKMPGRVLGGRIKRPEASKQRLRFRPPGMTPRGERPRCPLPAAACSRGLFRIYKAENPFPG